MRLCFLGCALLMFLLFAAPAEACDCSERSCGVKISALGYGEKTVAIPGARTSATLDEIQLAAAGAIVARIEQPNPGEVLRVELLKRTHGESASGVVQAFEINATDAAPVVRFDALDAGHYLVLAQGHEVWERRGELVDVEAGETKEILLRIAPFQLTVAATFGGTPVRDVPLLLTSRDGLWTELFDVDEHGEATMQLWQGGRMKVAVRGEGMTAPHVDRKTISETAATRWEIAVPEYEITGVVVDAETGKPIPNAALALNIRSSGSGLGVKTRADQNGVFRFAPVPHGRHTLKAAAASYPPGELTYTFLEPETTRKLVIRLDRASTVSLTVLDAAGAPIPEARVLDFRGSTRIGQSLTDVAGRVSLGVPEGEVRDVFVVPRDGSFAFTTLRAGVEPVTIRVAPPASRIALKTESADGPIPNVSVAVRYNGRLLPPEVLDAFVTMHGSRVNSDSQGRITLRSLPAGVYEFWPVASSAELRAIAAGGGPAAPVKIAAAPGENAAVLTFAAAP